MLRDDELTEQEHEKEVVLYNELLALRDRAHGGDRDAARRLADLQGGGSRRLRWTAFDVTSLLPEDWREDVAAVAAEANFRAYRRTPILSREAADVTHVTFGRVHPSTMQHYLPWLYKLYRSEFLELAERAWAEPIKPAMDDRYSVRLNVQRGTMMRFECHVDSNPVTGLLFFTGHPAGGGELMVGQDPDAIGIEEVERNGSAIVPQAGQLIFYDGKTYPHYTRALAGEAGSPDRCSHELLHPVMPRIRPPARAEPSPVRRRLKALR